MKLLTLLRQRFSKRLLTLQAKKENEILMQRIVEKHNMNDKKEQKKLIDQFTLMQTNKRVFGRKEREKIRDKVKFMIHYGLIKVV